ncbi:MAG: hypothetical protein AB7S26_21905 [Sandaracinaceae bacterium]
MNRAWLALAALSACAGSAHPPRVTERGARPNEEGGEAEPAERAGPGSRCARIIGAEPFYGGAPSVWATDSPLVASYHRIGRVRDGTLRGSPVVLGARVSALTSGPDGDRAVTQDGAVLTIYQDGTLSRTGDVGRHVFPITRAPAGRLVVRDGDPYGTLLTVDPDGAAHRIDGAPDGVVRDAVFVSEARAVLLLAGGAAVAMERRGGELVVSDRVEGVRELAVGRAGVEIASVLETPRGRSTPYGELRRELFVSARLRAPPVVPDLTPTCRSVALDEACSVVRCGTAPFTLRCGDGERALEGVPVPDVRFGDAFSLGEPNRFLLDLGAVYVMTREGDSAAFRAEEVRLPRAWSRDVRSAVGGWIHLASTHDHHAPGETDVLYRLAEQRTVELAAYEGRERAALLSDGTLTELRVVDGRPRLALGDVPGPLSQVTLPEGSVDAAFVDRARGVAVGADGSQVYATCDGGATWERVAYEHGERAPLRADCLGTGRHAGPCVTCEGTRCAIALEAPVAVELDLERAASAPAARAPLRPQPTAPPVVPVMRLECAVTDARAERASRLPPPTHGGNDPCHVEASGRDEGGRFTIGPLRVPCTPGDAMADDPNARVTTTLRGVARSGLLVDVQAGPRSHALWITERDHVRLTDYDVRAVALPGGHLFARASLAHGVERVFELGPHGVIGARVIDSGFLDPYIGVFLDAAPGAARDVLTIVPSGDSLLAFRVPSDVGALPSALAPVTTEPCAPGRAQGALARLMSPPVYIDGEGDRPYAYAADVDVGSPGMCVERIWTSSGLLARRGDGVFAGPGLRCRVSTPPRRER